jgi:Ni/Fe-hydrogenase 1 B-type cytochrome subunit
MTIIEPVRKNIEHPEQIKRYSSPLRLWHWANAVVISGSLITVLINSTILDDRSSAMFMKGNFQETGVQLTDEQTKTVAHAMSDNVWGIHIYFGYVLVTLLLFRLVLEIFQLADQKFIRQIKSIYRHYFVIKKQRELARNEMVIKTIYAVFYILLIIMATTGLFLAFEDFFAPYKAIRHSVKEVHGFCMYLILTFIVVHIAGVFLAERKNSKGIVSDMINGGRK